MVAACSQALTRGSCVLSDTGAPADRATAIAIVSWESSEQRIARIQVGRKRGPEGSWLSREMQFQTADALVERWRAVGFAIGTLADEQERDAERGAAAAPPVRPPTAPAPAQPRTPAPNPWTHAPRWLGIGPLTGPGLDSGPWRVGAWLRVAQLLGQSPFFAQLSASYALRPTRDQVRVQWATLGAGLGGLQSLSTLRLDLRVHAEFVAQNVRASAHDPSTGRDDGGSHWSPGLRGGVEAVWPNSSPVSAVLGAEGWNLSGGTAIRRYGDDRIGSSPASGFAFLIGCELRLP